MAAMLKGLKSAGLAVLYWLVPPNLVAVKSKKKRARGTAAARSTSGGDAAGGRAAGRGPRHSANREPAEPGTRNDLARIGDSFHKSHSDNVI
jgi:hypothetical protein